MTDNGPSQTEIIKVLKALVGALQIFRDHDPRISVAQIQATVVTALETMDTQNGDQLPTVRDYAERLKLSPSGASRLLSNLSNAAEGAAAPLLKSDRGPSAARSEAFVLTDEGRAVVIRCIEIFTGRRVENFDTHDFLSFAIARHSPKGDVIVELEARGPKTFLVSPRQNALSPTIHKWCIDHGVTPPSIKIVPGGVEMEFLTSKEAVHFATMWK